MVPDIQAILRYIVGHFHVERIACDLAIRKEQGGLDDVIRIVFGCARRLVERGGSSQFLCNGVEFPGRILQHRRQRPPTEVVGEQAPRRLRPSHDQLHHQLHGDLADDSGGILFSEPWLARLVNKHGAQRAPDQFKLLRRFRCLAVVRQDAGSDFHQLVQGVRIRTFTDTAHCQPAFGECPALQLGSRSVAHHRHQFTGDAAGAEALDQRAKLHGRHVPEIDFQSCGQHFRG